MKDERINKRIFMFYRWSMRVVPLMLMIAHWIYVGMSSNLPEAHIDFGTKWHIVPLYTMTYIFPLAFMLPASYFFKFCVIWRIPFLYLTGVNVLYIYNASLVCTPHIAGQCKLLMCVILVVYALCIAHRLSKN
jgi:hypothetical protein